VFEHRRFLDLIRYFVAFEDLSGGNLTKKIAGYHQYRAVETAQVIEELIQPAGSAGCGY